MTKRRITLPAINGIAASSLAGTVGTINLPQNFRYHEIELVYIDGGSSPADITATFGDIVVYKNNNARRTHTASELDHLNALNSEFGATIYNRQQVNTVAAMRQTLTIYFNEPWRKDRVQADSRSLEWVTCKRNNSESSVKTWQHSRPREMLT